MCVKLTFKFILIITIIAVTAACQSNQKKNSGPSAAPEGKGQSRDAGEANADNENIDDEEFKVEFWQSREKLTELLKEAMEKAKTDKENPKIFVRIANLSFLLGKVTVGRNSCKRSLKLRPGYQPGLLACARIELADENYDLSELTLDKLSKRNQATANVIELRAILALKKGDVNEASVLYQKAVEADAKNIKLKLNAGLLLLKYRQLDLAKAQFASALKLDKNNPIAKLHLGIILVAENETEKAKQKFSDILDDDDLADYAKIHLARVLEKEGDFVNSARNIASIDTDKVSNNIKTAVSKLSARVQILQRLRGKTDQKIKDRMAYDKYLEALKKQEEREKKSNKKGKS